MARQSICLTVLGMHRSGTSAYTGALKVFEVYIGERWLENQYEFKPTADLNERILNELDSSWDGVFALKENEFDRYKPELVRIKKENFQNYSIWAIKDPRICLLLPLYLNVFKALSISPYFIIPVRNPYEIAKSLHKREQPHFSKEKSLIIWMKYMLSAEKYSRGFPRVFARYSDLIKHPGKQIIKICNVLEITLPKTLPEVESHLNSFINPCLKHHKVDDNHVDSDSPDIVGRFYNLLLELCDKANGPYPILESIDIIRDEFIKMQKFFFHDEVKSNFIQDIGGFSDFLNTIGGELIESGKLKQAADYFKGLTQYMPDNCVFFNNLGVVYSYLKDIENAKQSFKKSIDIDPTYLKAKENMGDADLLPLWECV